MHVRTVHPRTWRSCPYLRPPQPYQQIPAPGRPLTATILTTAPNFRIPRRISGVFGHPRTTYSAARDCSLTMDWTGWFATTNDYGPSQNCRARRCWKKEIAATGRSRTKAACGKRSQSAPCPSRKCSKPCRFSRCTSTRSTTRTPRPAATRLAHPTPRWSVAASAAVSRGDRFRPHATGQTGRDASSHVSGSATRACTASRMDARVDDRTDLLN